MVHLNARPCLALLSSNQLLPLLITFQLFLVIAASGKICAHFQLYSRSRDGSKKGQEEEVTKRKRT